MKTTRVSPAWAWLISLSLLLACVWGQWHRVAHDTVPGVSAAVLSDAVVMAAVGSEVAGPDAALSDAAGHTAGSALCRVLDHLAHSDGMACAAALDMPTALPWATRPWQAIGPVHAHTQRSFEARAPPRFA